MSAADDVRDRTDIVDLVGQHTQLRKAGRMFKGLCPFHEERTPSFVVYPDTGRWHCFGACASGGDVFSFVMRRDGVTFREALETLAHRAGVILESPTPQAEAQKEQRDRWRLALAQAAGFYHEQLLRRPAGEQARAYLRERRFHRDAAQAFELGWAPEGWTTTRDALRAAGFSDEELLAAGLVKRREGGGVYDAFRSRLVFPIRDTLGRTVGFGARTLVPGEVPKYVNSPQSELFDKSRLLYGLDKAKSAIHAAGRAVVVEGYTDVIRAHMAGFGNVVASLGTALTETHVRTLCRYTRSIVLALDADAAGQAATLRGLNVAASSAGDVAPVVGADGWIRYEQVADVRLHVASLSAPDLRALDRDPRRGDHSDRE
jgi:DNA primase